MEWLLQVPVLFFSVIFHEFAHGYAAHRRGDDTAYLSGRLTFNPLPHIDPVGSLLVPALSKIMGLPMIGWAKPVPVNPYRMHNPRTDMAVVALSGPLSNVALIVAAALAYKVLTLGLIKGDFVYTLLEMFRYAIFINLALAVFNLIPVFPLDGSQIALGLLKGRVLEVYEKHLPYGFYIILGLVVTGIFKYVLMFPLWITALLLYHGMGIYILG